jgi:hypothetical protein
LLRHAIQSSLNFSLCLSGLQKVRLYGLRVKKWGFLTPRSVIGVKPTPFQFRLSQSLRLSGLCLVRLIGLRCKTALLFSILAGSLAKTSEIFLGWY